MDGSLRCSRCGARIDQIMFTSIRTGLFVCKRCFAEEVAKAPKLRKMLPDSVKSLIEDVEAEDGRDGGRAAEGLGLDEFGQPDDEPPEGLSAPPSPARAPAPRKRLEKLYGVLYFRDVERLDEAVAKIREYYARKVELLPRNAPRHITMDVYRDCDGGRLWALVIAAEVPADGQGDPKLLLQGFIEDLTGMEPRDVDRVFPEKVKKRMRPTRAYHVGHKRISDYMP